MNNEKAPGAAGQQAQERTVREPRGPQYIGPRYKAGLVLPNGRIVRPRRMNREEATALIQQHPPAALWFRFPR